MTGPPLVLGPMERVLHLRTLPALDRLTPPLLGAIAQQATERIFAAGEKLLEGTGVPQAVYIIVDGHVALEAGGRPPTSLHTGGTIGFLELLARLPRTITARAVTDTITLELEWEAQLEVCEQHFPILHAYLQFLAGQVLLETMRQRREVQTLPPHGGEPERSLDLVERAQALASVQAFSASSMDAIVELARHVTEVRHAAGHTLWRREDEVHDFLLITWGTVECSSRSGVGWLAGPSDALGMYEALAGLHRWHDAVARTPVRGLSIGVEPFLDILEDHFELAVELTSRLAAQLLELLDSRHHAAAGSSFDR